MVKIRLHKPFRFLSNSCLLFFKSITVLVVYLVLSERIPIILDSLLIRIIISLGALVWYLDNFPFYLEKEKKEAGK